MAFIRIERKKSGSYIRIVEGYRDENNLVKQKTLYNLGKVEDYKPEQLQRIGKTLIESATGNILDLKQHNIKGIVLYNYGFPLIYNHILKF